MKRTQPTRSLMAFTVIAAYCASLASGGDELKPYEGPKPIAVFIQSDPWAMVMGADTPRVAIYENGDVIFSKIVEKRRVYHTVSLEKDAFTKLREELKPTMEAKDLKARYDIRPNATDQPEAMFYLRDGEHEVVTTVRGFLSRGTTLPAYTEYADDSKPTPPPDELLKLHKRLSELDFPNSKEWTPKYVEVMLWDFSYAKNTVEWPKDWPNLKSERVIQRGDSYSVFLDGELLQKVREFVRARGQSEAVELDGKMWAISFRCAFPGELSWRKAFEGAEKR